MLRECFKDQGEGWMDSSEEASKIENMHLCSNTEIDLLLVLSGKWLIMETTNVKFKTNSWRHIVWKHIDPATTQKAES